MSAPSIPDTMLAFRFRKGAPEPVESRVPVPKELGPEEVLIKVAAAGLCHTDAHCYSTLAPILPDVEFTLGHEGAGHPVLLGSSVPPSIKTDRLYAVHCLNPCRSKDPAVCRCCASGHENACQAPTRAWYGLGLDGTWAEYVKCGWRDLVEVPEGVSAEVAAVATDAVLTPWHAATAVGGVKKGDVVLVIGCGGLGLNAIQVGKHLGATVIGMDRKPEALEQAKKAGANHAVASAELLGFLKDKGMAVDVVLDCVAVPETINLGLSAIGPRGRVVNVGAGVLGTEISFIPMMFLEGQLLTSIWGTVEELRDVLAAVAAGHIKPVVRPAPLKAALKEFHLLEKFGQTGRVAYVP
ncbi:hypothetical protein DFJ74DRAFT_673644 [Hyaloraphidium curvatum]|nr:hypothetical protein DFJ74DRAFT_673644 [Hyaloraphidium curvatum]